jgi:dipeptidase E
VAVHLGGGGSAFDEEALWRSMMSVRRRVLYWPFALPPERRSGAAAWLRGSVADLGLDVEVEVWSDLSDHEPAPLDTDLLFVGGGNTFHLLDHVRRAGFVDTVQAFVGAGGDYYGGSAGAVLAGESIAVAQGFDDNDLGLTDVTGLRLVHRLNVLPHYTLLLEDALSGTASRLVTDVVGIPEQSGVVVHGGLARVVGRAPVRLASPVGELRTVRPGDSWTLGS